MFSQGILLLYGLWGKAVRNDAEPAPSFAADCRGSLRGIQLRRTCGPGGGRSLEPAVPAPKQRAPGPHSPADRLDSWKDVATYLKRDVRTVQRWEQTRWLPVYRAPGGTRNAIFALKSELDRWWHASKADLENQQEPELVEHGDSPSIAVLPFANLSADKENEYFSDGLAEDILNLLAKIPGLKVIARTSAFAFRGKEQDIRGIAEMLGVNNVLEGSVRRAGNRLRVTAQLINAADGTHRWSERYDRELTDVFAIQDEIGEAISEALKVRLAPRARTADIEAYQNYLRGQYYRVRYTPESLAKAKECFEQALAIDRNYAPAYSGLAEYYYLLAAHGIKPTGDTAPLAKPSAEKALAIDPANSEAHSVLASLAAFCDYDWKAAEQYFHKAMAVEPVPPTVRFRYALLYLLPLGRVAEAMEQNRLALEIDPVSMPLHYGMAWSMYAAKQHQETIEYVRRALEIDANYYLIWFVMGRAQLHAGFAQEAITSLRRAVDLAPWYRGAWSLAAAYYQAGDYELGKEWARKLADPHGHTLGAADYYAATGDVDAMFEALDGAHRQRDVRLLLIQYFPFFDPYRTDPRYHALLQRMNLA